MPRPKAVGHLLSVDMPRPKAVGHLLSVVMPRPKAVGHLLSVVMPRPKAVGHLLHSYLRLFRKFSSLTLASIGIRVGVAGQGSEKV